MPNSKHNWRIMKQPFVMKLIEVIRFRTIWWLAIIMKWYCVRHKFFYNHRLMIKSYFIPKSEYKQKRLKELYDEFNKFYKESDEHLASVILTSTQNIKADYQYEKRNCFWLTAALISVTLSLLQSRRAIRFFFVHSKNKVLLIPTEYLTGSLPQEEHSPQIEAASDAYRAYEIKYKPYNGKVIQFLRLKFM